MSSSETPSTPTEPARRQGLRPWQLGLIGVLALALIVLGILAYPHSNTSSSPGTAKVGSQVPTFSVPSLSGSSTVGIPVTTEGAKTPTVLIFFASWCKPCQQEMPALSKAINDGAAGDATVIGINALDEKKPAKAFVAENDVTFPVGFDQAGTVTNGSFGFVGLPYVVFVNPKGIVTEIHPGALTPEQLKAGLATAA
jgi:peroxiredoxin